MSGKRTIGAATSILALLLIAATPCPAAALDMGELFTSNKALPDIQPAKIISGKYRIAFRWLSKTEKTCLHFPAYSNSPHLNFMGLKVWDVNIRFKNEKVTMLDASFYNRGDAGDIKPDQFQALLKQASDILSKWLAVGYKDLDKIRLPKNKGSISRRVWVNADLMVMLKWSESKIRKSRVKRPEFLQMEISHFDPKKDPRHKITASRIGTSAKKKVATLKDHIKTNAAGDKYLDGVPMVDQGNKGYCAVAIMERILRYYGQDVDQHVMAELAETKSGGGTYMGFLMEMVKKAGTRFHVKAKVHMKDPNSVDLMRYMEKYNKYRKKKKKKEDLDLITPVNGFEGNFIQVKKDVDTYREFRCEHDKFAYNKFRKAVISSVDAGIPLVWSVFLGLVPEKGISPMMFGGHARLIIGYNKKTDEIVYTDTWGAGHEFKKMPWKDAWTMTMSYANVYPRK